MTQWNKTADFSDNKSSSGFVDIMHLSCFLVIRYSFFIKFELLESGSNVFIRCFISLKSLLIDDFVPIIIRIES